MVEYKYDISDIVCIIFWVWVYISILLTLLSVILFQLAKISFSKDFYLANIMIKITFFTAFLPALPFLWVVSVLEDKKTDIEDEKYWRKENEKDNKENN